MDSAVGPRRTGLIVFSSRMVSVFTGFVFLTLVTHSLPRVSTFGLWEFILDLVIVASSPVGLVTYWATREVARGSPVGKTTQVAALLLSGVGALVYIGLSLGTFSWIGSSFSPFLVGLIMIPLSYWMLSTQAVVLGHNPKIGGYATVVSEFAKLAVAYPLLYPLHMGINGVILSIATGYLVQAASSSLLLGKAVRGPLQFEKAKGWLHDYPVPALYTLTQTLFIVDTLVAPLGQGGTDLVGYYQAAYQVGSVVAYSISLTIALYPLLLRGHSERLPGQVLEFSLLFGAPMAAGVIALAPRILFLFGPAYTSSTMALVILSFAGIANLVSSVVDASLMGREDADLSTQDRRRKILGSNLAFVPKVNLAYSLVYLATVFVIGRLSATTAVPVYQYAAYWALSQLVLLSVFSVYKIRRLLQKTPIILTGSVFYYVLSSTVMAVTLYFVSEVILPGSIGLVYGLLLAGMVLFGGAVYFGVLLGLDRKSRELARTLLSSLFKP